MPEVLCDPIPQAGTGNTGVAALGDCLCERFTDAGMIPAYADPITDLNYNGTPTVCGTPIACENGVLRGAPEHQMFFSKESASSSTDRPLEPDVTLTGTIANGGLTAAVTINNNTCRALRLLQIQESAGNVIWTEGGNASVRLQAFFTDDAFATEVSARGAIAFPGDVGNPGGTDTRWSMFGMGVEGGSLVAGATSTRQLRNDWSVFAGGDPGTAILQTNNLDFTLMGWTLSR